MDEKVHVLARSRKGTVEPLQFIFKNRRYSIGKIIKSRKEATQKKIFYHFAVDLLPEGQCELLFELNTGQWVITNGNLNES